MSVSSPAAGFGHGSLPPSRPYRSHPSPACRLTATPEQEDRHRRSSIVAHPRREAEFPTPEAAYVNWGAPRCLPDNRFKD
ncbi:hypothetical protein M408DRAFT_146417 [Serendipita vermifera MAFF 305830]|uniref:Uncharacterized protein n=1 Tax=Serendipita vermifera MAFF 305830 TaxID=933852 RepID=A0A0C3B722_SERVB|nr:hypothetical protein M408DRAFT_146417 [Serendipita vermifera MAFF 305830]